jgi:hypothetical protein
MASGTRRIQSLTATTGPAAPSSAVVTYGRAPVVGCSRLCCSHSTPSRRSSFQLVTLQTSAATPQSSRSSRCASIASRTAMPLASTWARGPSPSAAA